MNLWLSFHESPVEGLWFDSCSSFLFLVYFFDLCFLTWKGGGGGVRGKGWGGVNRDKCLFKNVIRGQGGLIRKERGGLMDCLEYF